MHKTSSWMKKDSVISPPRTSMICVLTLYFELACEWSILRYQEASPWAIVDEEAHHVPGCVFCVIVCSLHFGSCRFSNLSGGRRVPVRGRHKQMEDRASVVCEVKELNSYSLLF